MQGKGKSRTGQKWSCDAGQAMLQWELWRKYCPSEWPDLETCASLSLSPAASHRDRLHFSAAGTDLKRSDNWTICADSTPGPMVRWSWLPWACKAGVHIQGFVSILLSLRLLKIRDYYFFFLESDYKHTTTYSNETRSPLKGDLGGISPCPPQRAVGLMWRG